MESLPTLQLRSTQPPALPRLQLRSGPTQQAEPGAKPAPSGGGQPLPGHVQRKMERALNASFSAVRIHEGPQAQALGALAYTQGTDIFFAPGQYQPESPQGQELLGHELAHVVQQAQGRVQPTRQAKGVAINDDGGLEREADEMGARAARADDGGAAAAPGAAGAAGPRAGDGNEPAQAKCEACDAKERTGAEVADAGNAQGAARKRAGNGAGGADAAAAGGCEACGTGAPAQTGEATGAAPLQMKTDAAGAAGHVVQRWPGDGMLPPGDCDWGRYLALRGAVEAAKAIVSMLGSCAAGDNCTTLAVKIAAIATEIAARVALDTSCFRGGDTGHRQQVQDKINMMNRCYRFFQSSNCPQQLVEAMEAVVARAMEVMTAAAVAVVAVALIVALVVAIIALVEAIIAAGLAAGAAAVMAVLVLLIGLISPSEPTAPAQST